jgi:hypothetical protein
MSSHDTTKTYRGEFQQQRSQVLVNGFPIQSITTGSLNWGNLAQLEDTCGHILIDLLEEWETAIAPNQLQYTTAVLLARPYAESIAPMILSLPAGCHWEIRATQIWIWIIDWVSEVHAAHATHPIPFIPWYTRYVARLREELPARFSIRECWTLRSYMSGRDPETSAAMLLYAYRIGRQRQAD